MKQMRISVVGEIDGRVLSDWLHALILFRRKLRKLVGRKFPGCNTSEKIGELSAKAERIYSRIAVMDPDEYAEAVQGNDELGRRTDVIHAQTDAECVERVTHPEFILMDLCSTLVYLFKLARAKQFDWWTAQKIVAGGLDNPDYADAKLFLEGQDFDALTAMQCSQGIGEQLGRLEGYDRRTSYVSSKGGRARAKNMQQQEAATRDAIQALLAKRRSDTASSGRRISASRLAQEALYGDMTKLGFRKVADIAADELKRHKPA